VTRAAIGSVPAGRLVYFHDHGNPGPGLYLPTRWVANEARFETPGVLLPAPADARHLEPLAPQGYYRVAQEFECCDQRCRRFDVDQLVQLGYDGAARAILFVPELHDGALGVPDRGTGIDATRIAHLRRLHIAVARPPADRTMH
jgi:hypothetical protein